MGVGGVCVCACIFRCDVDKPWPIGQRDDVKMHARTCVRLKTLDALPNT